MIDPKYCTRSLSLLSTDEQILEATSKKEDFLAELFKDDIQKARDKKVNLGRVLRFLLHEWIQKNIPEDPYSYGT